MPVKRAWKDVQALKDHHELTVPCSKLGVPGGIWSIQETKHHLPAPYEMWQTEVGTNNYVGSILGRFTSEIWKAHRSPPTTTLPSSPKCRRKTVLATFPAFLFKMRWRKSYLKPRGTKTTSNCLWWNLPPHIPLEQLGSNLIVKLLLTPLFRYF